jgi:hypothetical protein
MAVDQPRQIQIPNDELEAFGERIRALLPDAEFTDHNGEWSLTITITREHDDHWTVTY